MRLLAAAALLSTTCSRLYTPRLFPPRPEPPLPPLTQEACDRQARDEREEPFHFEVLSHALFFSAYWSHLRLFSAQHCMVGQPFPSHWATSTCLDELCCLSAKINAGFLVSYIYRLR